MKSCTKQKELKTEKSGLRLVILDTHLIWFPSVPNFHVIIQWFLLAADILILRTCTGTDEQSTLIPTVLISLKVFHINCSHDVNGDQSQHSGGTLDSRSTSRVLNPAPGIKTGHKSELQSYTGPGTIWANEMNFWYEACTRCTTDLSTS